MKKLLEPKTVRKIEIIHLLTEASEPQNMNQIATKLNLNIKTLLSTIDEINYDAKRLQQSIEIERYSRSELKLTASNDFSPAYLKFKYFQEAPCYQIIDIKFKNPNETLNNIAEENHMSQASLYRKTLQLKEIFSAFNLEFDAHHSFPIRGDEKQIRYFYYNFYRFHIQIFEWPFSKELLELSTQIYEKTFNKIFTIQKLEMKEKCILWIAINLIRTTDFHLQEAELLDMKHLVEDRHVFQKFKKGFEDGLSELNLENEVKLNENDLLLMFTLLASDEDFLESTEFRQISITSGDRPLFEKATIVFLENIRNEMGFLLNAFEYARLSNNLLRVLMEAYFFPQTEIFFTFNYRFDFLSQHYYGKFSDKFEKFYHNSLTEDMYQIFKTNKNIYYELILLAVDTLDVLHFNPEINVYLFKEKSIHLDSYYRKKIQTMTYSPIKFVEDYQEGDVDLIVSHNMSNDKNLNWFIMNKPATQWDWERLDKELKRIQELKKMKSI